MDKLQEKMNMLLSRRGILYLLPYFAAVSLIVFFSYMDKYPYDRFLSNDQALFQRIAENIASGGEFSGSTGGGQIFCPTRPPLYPLLIALTWKITGSRSLVYIRTLQALSYLFVIYFIFRISSILSGGNKTYGLMSSLLASLVPQTAAMTHVILSDSLAIFFLCGALFFAVSLSRKRSPGYSAALGLFLGLLILQRPNFILLTPFLIGYVIFSCWRKGNKSLAPVLVVMALFIATVMPWSMYKEARTGSYAPLYSAVGFNIIGGLIENLPDEGKGIYRQFYELAGEDFDRRPFYKEMEGLVLSRRGGFGSLNSTTMLVAMLTYTEAWKKDPSPVREVKLSNDFLEKNAFEWIGRHPLEYSGIAVKNGGNMLFGHDEPLIYHEISGPLYRIAFAAKIVLYILFIAGTLLLLKAGNCDLAFFPVLTAVYIIITNSVMHTEPRYFIYAYPLMAMTAPSVFALFPGLAPER